MVDHEPESEVAETHFVVLAAPRTGSNWLCTLLDSHPDILCHHEIFNPDKVAHSVSFRGSEWELGTVQERDADPRGFLRRVWSHPKGHSIVGFKLNRDQEQTIFDEILQEASILKILLKRRNRIKTYVSEAIALKNGEWESYRWSQLSGQPVRIRVDLDQLRKHLQRNAAYYDWLQTRLRETGQPCLELTYERLNEPMELNRALEYLGAAPQPLQGATRKQNSSNLRELIINFNEVERHLQGSELAEELHRSDL